MNKDKELPAAPSPDVEAQARELLAAEYERDGRNHTAQELRDGYTNNGFSIATRAITAALRQPPGDILKNVEAAPGAELLKEYDDACSAMVVHDFDRDGDELAIRKRQRIDKARADIVAAIDYAQQPVQAAPGAVGVVSALDNGERFLSFIGSEFPPVGTKLYAAPHATPVVDADSLRRACDAYDATAERPCMGTAMLKALEAAGRKE